MCLEVCKAHSQRRPQVLWVDLPWSPNKQQILDEWEVDPRESCRGHRGHKTLRMTNTKTPLALAVLPWPHSARQVRTAGCPEPPTIPVSAWSPAEV